MLFLAGLFYFVQKDELTRLQHSEILVEFVELLSNEWKYPELQNSIECVDEKIKKRDHYSCNPTYLSCILKNNYFNPKIKGRPIEYELHSQPKLLKRRNKRSYQLNMEIEGKDHTLEIVDGCRETFLPQRFYRFFVANRDIKTDWDNFGRHIYIDKYRVKNWEVQLWAQDQKREEILTRYKSLNPLESARDLNKEEMKQYCEFFGKHVLSAQIFDAATIHPEEIDNPESKLLRGSYYSWVRRNSMAELYSVQFENNDITEENLNKLCVKTYGFECLHLSKEDNLIDSSSWSGIKEVFGGDFQYLKNNINPSENLFLSSEYFTLKSKVHTTGQRGGWTGDGFTRKEFNFKEFREDLKKEGDFGVNFRCMRYR